MSISSQTIGAITPTTVYTSSGASAITFLSLCNTSASVVTVDVYIVKSGFSAGSTNIFVSQLAINAGDTYIVYRGSEKLLLDSGDFISVAPSAASVVTAIVSYAGY